MTIILQVEMVCAATLGHSKLKKRLRVRTFDERSSRERLIVSNRCTGRLLMFISFQTMQWLRPPGYCRLLLLR